MSTAVVRLVNCPSDLQPAVRQALLDAGLLPEDDLRLAPELVVLWPDPATAAAEVAALRESLRPASPAVLAVGVPLPGDCPAALALDVDACLPAAPPAEIAHHCAVLARCRERFLQTSPLTGLPGAPALGEEMARRLPDRGSLAALAFDLDGFKSYNDRYGYQRGDELLRWLASLLLQALGATCGPGWLLGHIGGDDFLALVAPGEAAAAAAEAIARFAAGVSAHYDPDDQAAGGFILPNRQGVEVFHPLCSLTVAMAGNTAADITHAGQIAAILAELKTYGKSLPGSNYVPDRRRSHGVRGAADPGATEQGTVGSREG